MSVGISRRGDVLVNQRFRNAILSALFGFFITIVISIIVYGKLYWLHGIGIAIGSFISYYLFIDRKRSRDS